MDNHNIICLVENYSDWLLQCYQIVYTQRILYNLICFEPYSVLMTMRFSNNQLNKYFYKGVLLIITSYILVVFCLRLGLMIIIVKYKVS